jgi:hypothetical protein
LIAVSQHNGVALTDPAVLSGLESIVRTTGQTQLSCKGCSNHRDLCPSGCFQGQGCSHSTSRLGVQVRRCCRCSIRQPRTSL